MGGSDSHRADEDDLLTSILGGGVILIEANLSSHGSHYLTARIMEDVGRIELLVDTRLC